MIQVGGDPAGQDRGSEVLQLGDDKVYDARELLRSVEGTIGPRGPDERDAWMPRKGGRN